MGWVARMGQTDLSKRKGAGRALSRGEEAGAQSTGKMVVQRTGRRSAWLEQGTAWEMVIQWKSYSDVDDRRF